MNIFWTEKAVELVAIHDYAGKVSPQYANGLVNQITQRSKQIAAFPAPVGFYQKCLKLNRFVR